MGDEATLGVKEHTEELSSLLKLNDIHEASGEGVISADLSIDLNKALMEDVLNFIVVKGILQAVAKENSEGNALSKLMGTLGRAGSVETGKLIKHPVRRSCDALKMLLGTTSHAVYKFSLQSKLST